MTSSQNKRLCSVANGFPQEGSTLFPVSATVRPKMLRSAPAAGLMTLHRSIWSPATGRLGPFATLRREQLQMPLLALPVAEPRISLFRAEG
jgi:hypothetical protein